MAKGDFKTAVSRSEVPISVLLSAAFSLVLFVVMALAQMTGDVHRTTRELVEEVIAYTPPELEDFEEEPPSPVEKDDPPPELEAEPPPLSLAQLDLVLNPGLGGAIQGDFSMPRIDSSAGALGTVDFVDSSDLDRMPKPLPGSTLEFPRRLKKKSARGRVVLLIKLDEEGRVVEVHVESSSLPAFDDIVARQVSRWRFTPPTLDGQPVRAEARFPIPIRIGG